jgi:H+-transporting ATPase
MTIYVTRNTGALWSRPWPNWRLVVAAESTQVLGTLAAVYGWFVEPIGWGYALLVWGYALVWLLVNSVLKIGVERLLRREGGRQARHLSRIAERIH